MSAEQNKSIVRRWVETAWNSRDLSLLPEIIAPNFVMNDSTLPSPVDSPAALYDFIVMWHSAFPDLYMQIEDMVAEGDKVAWRFTFTGTHQGTLFNLIPPTGNQINVGVTLTSRFENGRWAEDWVNGNWLGMFQQLGVIPALA